NARSFIPRLGRFLTSDPIGGDPYNPQSISRYAYVKNDPINLTDPTGLCGFFLGDEGLGDSDPICANVDGTNEGGGGDGSECTIDPFGRITCPGTSVDVTGQPDGPFDASLSSDQILQKMGILHMSYCAVWDGDAGQCIQWGEWNNPLAAEH